MGKILLKNIVTEGVVTDILIDGERIAGIFPAGTGADPVAEGTVVVDCKGTVSYTHLTLPTMAVV